jgi:hypothetical protein
VIFDLCSPCWGEGVIAGTIVENGSSPARSAGNTTWSQDLALGVNGPIPVIVVDQFGYPTKASKIAVMRDPNVGYDNAGHFTPGTKGQRRHAGSTARISCRGAQSTLFSG